jgi:hypothetical protein
MIVAATLGTTSTQQTVQQAVAGAGSMATAIGIAAHASWVPVVGIGVAAVTLALGLIFSRKGPAQKVAATKIVDQIEPQLKANVEAYMSGPRTRSSQAQALSNYDAAWQYVISPDALGNPELGNPGKVGIADRDRGGKWDWFAYYRDPIANDPNVRDDTAAIADTISQATQGKLGWALGLGLLAAGVLL